MNVFVLNTKEDVLKNEANRAVLDHSIFIPTVEVNGAPKQPAYKVSSQHLPLCSAEQTHSYREEMMTDFSLCVNYPVNYHFLCFV